MSNAQEWIWRLAYATVVIGGLAIALLTDPVYGFWFNLRQYPLLSTVILGLSVMIVFSAIWLFLIVGFPSSVAYLATRNTSKETPGKTLSWDGLFETDAYETRTFHLLRDKGAKISLECPSEKCMEFELGELRTTEGVLEQQIFLNGDGFDTKSHPDPANPNFLFKMGGRLRLRGAQLEIPMDGGKMSAWIALRRDSIFEFSTRHADVKFTIVDLQVDALKINLEVRPSSLSKRREAMRHPAPTPDKEASPP